MAQVAEPSCRSVLTYFAMVSGISWGVRKKTDRAMHRTAQSLETGDTR